jgi:hypothetical protein
MTTRTDGHTKSGKPIDDGLIEKLADDAERGYAVDEIISASRQARSPSTRFGPIDRRVRPTRPGTQTALLAEPRMKESRSPRSSETRADTTSKRAEDFLLGRRSP